MTGNTAVIVSTEISLVGVGSGNTFTAYGNAIYDSTTNNPSIHDLCPTAGSSITCVSTTAPGVTAISSLTWSGGVGTVVTSTASAVTAINQSVNISGATNTGTGGAAAVNHQFTVNGFTNNQHFTLSMFGAPGVFGTIAGSSFLTQTPFRGSGGYIQFLGNAYGGAGSNCSNVSVKHIFFDGSLVTDGGSIAGTLNFLQCSGPIIVDDIRLLTFDSTGVSSESQFAPDETDNITVQNSVFAAPVDIANTSFYSGVELLNWGLGNTGLFKNNVLYQGAYNPIATDNVLFTGNVYATYFDGTASPGLNPAIGLAGCSPGATCPTNGLTTGSYHFNVSNNYLYAAGSTIGNGGGVNDPGGGGGVSDLNFTGNWITGSKGSIAGCIWHVFSSCISGSTNGGTVDGMQVNGTGGGRPAGSAPCSIDPTGTCFNITNNSIVASTNAILDATGNGINSPSAPDPNHNNTTVNFNASQNYMSSPGNQYLTDVNSTNPHAVGNYCVTSTFTQTDSSTCATTGFTTPPSASFTLGPVYLSGSTYYAPFATTTFTAQYGAVKWLASKSATSPTSGGQTGTGCNGAACSWSFVPPVYLAGATHGDTVYLWTMDSVNNISSSASAVIP